MKKFRFRLERLLWLREQAERQQAASLGSAMLEEQRERDTHEHASEVERRSAERAASVGQSGLSTAGARAHLDLARDAAARAAAAAAEGLEAARERTEQVREVFGQKRRDRRAVERLKDKRQAAWHDELGREERRTMDDVAQRPRNREGSR